ncbi:MAG: hypothetical protein CFE23_11770 [Flavobacterium sp. BFFFF1]|uniref:hypothetical protein n=1 Tax=Flavobacterium sp. BFFFF1 TaxID=2015557 RepID=UPI000BDBAF6E|nr:hypothetical protein [Flavobacterium sp. BFFFF1]OYU79926.1 MAG: hypothetical protein CFE23_11770 [Flavobacterium sp. BFFFF1]
METPNERLRQRIEKDGGTLKEWCQKYHVDYKTIQLMTSGVRPVTQKKLMPLEESVPDFDAFHILHGVKRYKTDDQAEENVVLEPGRLHDPFEGMLLQYLQSEPVKREITKIVAAQLQAKPARGAQSDALLNRIRQLIREELDRNGR